MVFRSPFTLITIPIALALGVFWFRRKKIHCDSGGDTATAPTKQLDTTVSSNLNRTQTESKTISQLNISVPIEQSPCKSQVTPPSRKLSKSAPIDITPHKTSPKRATNITVEKPADNTKADDANELNSIEESSSCESVDLPGSSNRRRRFSFTIRTNEPTIVVKANHMDARDLNKSPQSSFEQLTSPSDSGSVINSSLGTPKMVEKSAVKEVACVAENSKANSSRVTAVASPPLSLCSNNTHQSEESGDSGQGGSIPSPPNSDNGTALEAVQQRFDFQLPQTMVKFLVGKSGATIRKIRQEANVEVLIQRHPTDSAKYKWCTVQGSQQQIDNALIMIKTRLPPKATIEPMDIELMLAGSNASNMAGDPNVCQALYLIEGINNDVAISAVNDAGHLYVQQPLHPTYPRLHSLQNKLRDMYSATNTPLLQQFTQHIVCVGRVETEWYRLQIIEHNPANKTCVAKYLDFGSHCVIATNDLRQISYEFATLPFQAVECFLADIKPKDGCQWSIEANALVQSVMDQFPSIQAQIVGYTDQGIPEILLFVTIAPQQVVCVNDELVALNFAERLEYPNIAT